MSSCPTFQSNRGDWNLEGDRGAHDFAIDSDTGGERRLARNFDDGEDAATETGVEWNWELIRFRCLLNARWGRKVDNHFLRTQVLRC